jgi:hypothetical protein
MFCRSSDSLGGSSPALIAFRCKVEWGVHIKEQRNADAVVQGADETRMRGVVKAPPKGNKIVASNLEHRETDVAIIRLLLNM